MKKGLKLIVCIILLCVPIRLLIGEPCYVPSESMEPTLYAGDWVWVNKASYGALLPVCFADIPLLNVFTWIEPLRLIDDKNHWREKRSKGMDTPEVRDVIVFHSPQNKKMLLVKRIIRKSECNGILYYYVMGDNRENSLDSRVFGRIPEMAIVGKINRVLYSTNDWRRILKKIE